MDSQWKPQDLANTAWSMTTMQIQPPTIMAQVVEWLGERMWFGGRGGGLACFCSICRVCGDKFW